MLVDENARGGEDVTSGRATRLVLFERERGGTMLACRPKYKIKILGDNNLNF